MKPPTIAVVGASSNRHKFANKCVRAFQSLGWTVFPVHPVETEVEGLPVFKSVADIPVEGLDAISVYLSPALGLKALDSFVSKQPGEIFFNPGAESPEILAKAKELGLNAKAACSIVAYGLSPSGFADK